MVGYGLWWCVCNNGGLWVMVMGLTVVGCGGGRGGGELYGVYEWLLF